MAEITSWMVLQHVGTKLCPANGAFWLKKPRQWKYGQAGAFAGLPDANNSGFGCEGKPDNARKSRLFNNLEALSVWIGLHSWHLRSLTTHPGRPEAIVVLVE
jgi:hypothetical protein